MRSRQLLSSEFELPTRVSFRAWPSHGEFAPSLDGRHIYFGENGPGGLVLKRASLSDGGVVTVLKTSHEIDHLAVVPGNGNRLVLAWQAGLGGSPPYEISIVDLAQGREWPLDVGSTGSDGDLLVSPSGRFLAAGTGLVGSCRPLFASEVAVFSLATGKREFTYTLRSADGSPAPENADSPPICSRKGPRGGWTANDVLIVSNGADVAFQRRGDSWSKTRTRGTVEPRIVSVRRPVSPDEPLSFQRTIGGKVVELARVVLFEPGGSLSVYNLSNQGIALSEDDQEDGWSSVEAVVLEWKPTRPKSASARSPLKVLLTDSSIRLTQASDVTQVVVELVAEKPVDETAGIYRGQVIVAVRLTGRPWVRTNVSTLLGQPSMQFVENPWQLVFDDYDRDGRLDFNLGQQCGSNNGCYWLFRIETSGRISLIPVEPHPRDQPGGVLANSDGYSAEIELTDDGISTWFYDPAEGASVKVWYRWDRAARSFVMADRRIGRQ